MDAAYIEFPFDVVGEFGAKGQVKVKAIFDDRVDYRGSLAKMGLELHCLGMTKKIRELLGKTPGDTVSVALQADVEPRIVELPEDLMVKLRIDKLEDAFRRLPYTKQKEYVGSVLNAKKTETRNKRIADLIQSLNQIAE